MKEINSSEFEKEVLTGGKGDTRFLFNRMSSL